MSLSSDTGSSRAPEDKKFVPMTYPTEEDDHLFNKLIFMGYNCGLIIDSVNLKFTGEVVRERSVYGKIRINTHTNSVCTIYDRSPATAETISSPPGGDLTLCGPRYFVAANGPTALYVDLYEKGVGPLFGNRVPLKPLLISPNLTKFQNVPLGEVATLGITVTGISPCAPTDFQMMLLYPHSYKEWLVSGSVTAVQAIAQGTVKKRLRLFERSDECPERVVASEKVDPAMYPGRSIAEMELDRDVVLAPVWLEGSYIQEMNEYHEKRYGAWTGLYPEKDLANGRGSYLSLEVDLKLVEEDSGECCLVEGCLHFQFKGSHADGGAFIASVKGKDVVIKDEGEIEVQFVVVPTTDISCTMGDEPFEFNMPFYKCHLPDFKSGNEFNAEEKEMLDTDTKDEF